MARSAYRRENLEPLSSNPSPLPPAAILEKNNSQQFIPLLIPPPSTSHRRRVQRRECGAQTPCTFKSKERQELLIMTGNIRMIHVDIYNICIYRSINPGPIDYSYHCY